MADTSVFTKIINRELPATIRYEDEDFIVFDNINPNAPVHVLVVPKHPYATMEEVELKDTAFHSKLLQTARSVAKDLGIGENYKLVMNVGKGIQMVPHVHLHLMGGWKDPKESWGKQRP